MRLSFALLLALGLIVAPACSGNSDDDAGSETGDGDGDGDGDTDLTCADEWVAKDPESGVESIMQTWGAACENNQDCIDLLGFENAECITNILDIYTPPGGYCTRPCTLPGNDTLYVPDADDCDPEGGVTCLGAKGIFEKCAIACNEHDQCGREGYGCILMPQLGNEANGDPKFCLMNPDTCCVAGDACP